MTKFMSFSTLSTSPSSSSSSSSMTMVLAGGFVLGSAVTAIVLSLLYASQQRELVVLRRKQKKDNDDNAPVTINTRSLVTQSIRPEASHLVKTSFFTDMIQQLWSYILVAGADKIRANVEPSFAALPAPMNSIKFTKIDLGHVPLRMDNILVHDVDKVNGHVQMDMDIVWDGFCDIQLHGDYIGSFGVKSIKLQGRLSMLFKPLTTVLPLISGIQYAFINPPVLELDFTGLAQVADFAIIDKKIRQVMNESLLSMVLPYRSLYKMDVTNPWLKTYHAPLGVARVTVESGYGFVVEKRLIGADDIPDVYLNVTLGQSNTWKTSVIKDNVEPVWNESSDFLLDDVEQLLKAHAWDEDTGPLDPDDDLGQFQVSISELFLSGNTKTIELCQDLKDPTGAFVTMSVELCPWTLDDLSSLDQIKQLKKKQQEEHNMLADSKKKNATAIAAAKAIAPVHIGGLLTIAIGKAYKLPIKNVKDASSFVKVTFGHLEYSTVTVVDYPGYDCLTPEYDFATYIPMTVDTIDVSEIKLELCNNNIGNKKTPYNVLGTVTIPLQKLYDAPNHTITELKGPIGKGGALLEYEIVLAGVRESSKKKQSLNGIATQPKKASQSIPTAIEEEVVKPLQEMNGKDGGDDENETSVKVTAVKGRGFQIKPELFNIAIPDLYLTIQVGNEQEKLWRTKTITDKTNPEWNESKVYNFPKDVAQGKILTIHVHDQNEREFDPDQLVGTCQVTIGKVLLNGGICELELQKDGKGTGAFVTIGCEYEDYE